MLIIGTQQFIETSFDNEAELEKVVVDNAELIFGSLAIYLDKALFKTPGGSGTIPDGFVIDLESGKWFVVEAELGHHSVWNHIAPQVAKQMVAVTQPSSKSLFVQKIIEKIEKDPKTKIKFSEAGISDLHIHGTLTQILNKEPIVALPIDEIPPDLKEWAATFKHDVKLWVVKKFVEFGNPQNVIFQIPDESPSNIANQHNTEIYGTGISSKPTPKITGLLSCGLVSIGEKLTFKYKHYDEFSAEVTENGSLQVNGKLFSSPSYAAVYCMQTVGSTRKTCNGWICWRNVSGVTLDTLREQYAESINELENTDPN